MPLIKILGGATAVLFIVNVVQCGRENNLHKELGQERQACLTRFAEAEVEYEKELARVQAEMAADAATAIAALTNEIEVAAAARHAAELSRREVETRLASAMERLNEEDEEWGATLLPSYLLSQ